MTRNTRAHLLFWFLFQFRHFISLFYLLFAHVFVLTCIAFLFLFQSLSVSLCVIIMDFSPIDVLAPHRPPQHFGVQNGLPRSFHRPRRRPQPVQGPPEPSPPYGGADVELLQEVRAGSDPGDPDGRR